ncbi:hypothetical protein [Vibrio mangrovi]|uniref:Bacterial SH3 domain protein n=1 Tax=Vibrio mangrovi TaxID=474394 RepID=A0A1Y6IX04_9VIBR|nr:hypothetical protein [Vibrio mangrovi]MDW6005373.1 hypothetical protein [Vibrio mangrovi]SMS02187.1 hypothetical protein VIM7927_03505 [Vibrio mangrovi]
MYKKVLLIGALFFSTYGNAASYSQDTGSVSQVYVSPSGSIALLLQGGYPNAVSSRQCPSSNGWAGVSNADGAFKSVILAAKTSGQKLTVTINGCEGGWFKIQDLYLQ